MRQLTWVLLLALGACSSCDEDEPVRASETVTREESQPEPEPEPPDPCPGAEEALQAFLGPEPVIALSGMPTGHGGSPLEDGATTVWVEDTVHLGEQELGAPEEAAEPLSEAVAAMEGPDPDEPIVLVLRASDPVSRIAPLLRAFPKEQQFGLVVVETDREHPQCRSVRQLVFGLRQGDEHGWASFPSARPVSDLVIALGGADEPRRVDLLE